MDINIKKLVPEAVIPFFAKHGDAAMDLTAVSRVIDKHGNVSYGTGLAMEIPLGYVGLIFPRSSVSKYNMGLANSVGVIDSGYRGEIICKFKPTPEYVEFKESIQVELKPNELGINISLFKGVYEVGERVAQLMIIERQLGRFHEVEELSDSERGEGGFGSSGK